jgi:hypothetical protein
MVERKPKKDVKYFFFDEDNKFVVDGNKLRMLPLCYHKYYTRHEFYVYVNAKEKKAQYYAFDRMSIISGERINEASGIIPWDKEVEDSIYSFFISNIRELTSETYSYSDAGNVSGARTYPPTQPNNQGFMGGGYNYNSYASYGSDAYKERESVLERLRNLQKVNFTTKTVDYISETFAQMRQENKTSIIDDVLRNITIDKMDIVVMVELLNSTKNIEGGKEWEPFCKKVKDHIMKVNPRRAEMIFKTIGGN